MQKNKTKIINSKKEIILALAIFFIAFSYLPLASAFSTSENVDPGLCYSPININEKTLSSYDQRDLSYTGLDNIYGNYSDYINPYNDSNSEEYAYADGYVLRTYNDYQEPEYTGCPGCWHSNLIGKYFLTSSLFSFTPYYNETTGREGYHYEEVNESTTSIIIPYDASINRLTIEYNGTERPLSGFNPSAMKCERTCAIQNETGNWENDSCCQGLIPSDIDGTNFKCISCGDGICSENEDQYTCSEDCAPKNFSCPDGMIKGEFYCVQPNVCGNGIKEGSEQCDEGYGNINDYPDGCSITCKNNSLICTDFDSSSSFSNSLFNASYVFYGGNVLFDSCVDSTHVLENYCGIHIGLDFWNIQKVGKTTTRECQYGCSNGACSTQPLNISQPLINETCSDGIQNQNEIEIDCGGVCGACQHNQNSANNPDGLVAYYPFDGNANDAFGINNGSIIDSSLNQGVIGNAYNFGSSTSKISLNKSIFSGLDNFSMSLYFKNTYSGLSYLYGDNSTSIMMFGAVNGTTLFFYSRDDNYHPIDVTDNQIFDGNWHSYIWTRDNSGKVDIYIDGIKLAEEIFDNGIKDSSSSTIGNCLTCSGGGAYSGAIKSIDEVRVYNRVLNQEEIQNFASKTALAIDLPPEPVVPEQI